MSFTSRVFIIIPYFDDGKHLPGATALVSARTSFSGSSRRGPHKAPVLLDAFRRRRGLPPAGRGL